MKIFCIISNISFDFIDFIDQLSKIQAPWEIANWKLLHLPIYPHTHAVQDMNLMTSYLM